mgnify:CR=1 FL=1
MIWRITLNAIKYELVFYQLTLKLTNEGLNFIGSSENVYVLDKAINDYIPFDTLNPEVKNMLFCDSGNFNLIKSMRENKINILDYKWVDPNTIEDIL